MIKTQSLKTAKIKYLCVCIHIYNNPIQNLKKKHSFKSSFQNSVPAKILQTWDSKSQIKIGYKMYHWDQILRSSELKTDVSWLAGYD